MQKKAQVLIIFIWILVVLVILVVSIGQRAAMTFRFIQYQKDRQSALYLAKAGINRAIVELENDLTDPNTNDYDALNENWSTGIDFQTQQPIFGNIELVPASGETFGVTITDEERKININKASKEILSVLLEDFDISPAEEIASNILVWCGDIAGDIAGDNKIYENLGYPVKAKDFTNTQELMLVKDIASQDYQELKEFITVYTDGLININTVSDPVLRIITYGVAKELGIAKGFAQNVVDKIIALKIDKGYFKEKNEINISTTGDEELNIFNKLMNNITFKSNKFSIEAIGRTGKIETKVTAIYNRNEGKILSWNED